MDSSDLKIFAILAVIGVALYLGYVHFVEKRGGRLTPSGNTPTVSYTPIGVPSGK